MAGALEGKSAIVTGAGSGVGRASALRFAEEGARVVVADIELDQAKETVRLIEAAGGTAIAVGVDVANEAQVQAMIAAAVEQYGRLDILFNNVGIPTPRLGLIFEDHTLEDFNRLVSVNLGGVFLGCNTPCCSSRNKGTAASSSTPVRWRAWWDGAARCTAPPRGGASSSPAPSRSRARRSGFGSTPSALPRMPLTGFMAAGGLKVDAEQQAAIADKVGEQHPLGRPITAEDCADAAVYLCSDAARNVTGVALPIDGGFVAR